MFDDLERQVSQL